MAGTSPAMTVKAGFIQDGSADRLVELAMTGCVALRDSGTRLRAL
jgi:hypothetical protein